jgi:ADP-ribose pyrophosphatase
MLADRMSGVPEPVLAAIRARRPIPDSRPQALFRLAQELVRTSGKPDAATGAALLAAGFTERAAPSFGDMFGCSSYNRLPGMPKGAGMKVRLIEEQTRYAGFYRLRRLTLEHERYDGGMMPALVREVVERSDVAAALLYDPARDAVVMVEQFRVGPYAAAQPPWLLDIVAGRIAAAHTPEDTIAREVREEAGIGCLALRPIGRYYTAPHISSERVHLYCAHVDASCVSGTHGIADEGEDIRPVVLARTEALRLVETATLSLWAGLALQWLAGQSA